MKQLAYKLKYGGFGKIFLSGILSPVFIFLFFIVSSEITPASVSVSGYTKKDGTYVHSYSRRPPGSVDHDAPYQTMQLVFGLAGVSSGIYCIIKINIFKKFDIDAHYLANFNFKDKYPTFSITKKAVPTKMVIPRKSWNCDICRKVIYPDTVYYCYNKERNYTHICSNCKDDIEKENRRYYREKKIFDIQCEKIKQNRIEEFTNQYRKDFEKNAAEKVINAI